MPEAAVLLAGRIDRIYEPREGDSPGRRVFVQTNDGAAALRLSVEQEQALSAPVEVGQHIAWVIRYRIWLNDEKKPYLTKRFVREFSESDREWLEQSAVGLLPEPALKAV